MKKPVLDHRTQGDVMEQLRKRAASYTPEWNFDGDPSDPGAALAAVFGEMYTYTLDRFNSLPNKFYIEFLNLLGVTETDAESASGYVRFVVQDIADQPVTVPERTLLGAPDEEDRSSILFETVDRIGATPARLESLFYRDAREDVLQKLDLSRIGQPLFGPVEGPNISEHTLLLSQNEVLAVEGNCIIQVELHQKNQYQDNALAEILADPERAEWDWFDGMEWNPFREVTFSGNRLFLHKGEGSPLGPNEEGRLLVRCRAFHPSGDVILEEVRLSSESVEETGIEEMFFEDLPLEDGRGFCFGKRPTIYDAFYLRSDRVFCKRGSRVAVKMNIAIEVDDPTAGDARYDWTRHIINKEDTYTMVPDDVVIRRVIWEYFNGIGWTVLPMGGDRNPFIPSEKEIVRTFTFQVPGDMMPSAVNSREGYYIRGRIAEIDNLFSPNQRWMLPYVTGASCRWSYDTGCRCQYLAAINDGDLVELDGVEGVERLRLRAFYLTESQGRSLYFRFHRSPHAMPLTLFLELTRHAFLPGKVRFEVMRNGHFYPTHTTDGTRNFSMTGVISLYLPEELTRERLFGEEGCWIRATCDAARFEESWLPRQKAIHINVSSVMQRQQAEPQYFDTGAYAKNKSIQLLLVPVQDVGVWINETGHVTDHELRELRSEPFRVMEEAGESWVRWKRVRDIRLASGDARVFEMDTSRGTIRFGDNIHGKIPPEGTDNILVRYANGGGTVGNLPKGAIRELYGAVPMIDSIENVTATCGGTERGNQDWLEQIGTLSLRHRNRALGIVDYEDMVLQRFPRTRQVKCFAGLDEEGKRAPGHVTVVFLCAKVTDFADTNNMAQQIYRFLAERSECTLVSDGRLHVMPAKEMQVSAEVQVELYDLNRAADTQRDLSREITNLINNVWRQRGIGQEPDPGEVYELLSRSPNVALIRQILLSGTWFENGVEYACNLEEKRRFPYTAYRSGEHTIRVV